MKYYELCSLHHVLLALTTSICTAFFVDVAFKNHPLHQRKGKKLISDVLYSSTLADGHIEKLLYHDMGEFDPTLPASPFKDESFRLKKGTHDGLYVAQEYSIPKNSLLCSDEDLLQRFGDNHVKRLNLTSTNLTLSAVLMLIDPIRYPTFSKSRKAIRTKRIALLQNNGIDREASVDEDGHGDHRNKTRSLRIGTGSDRIILEHSLDRATTAASTTNITIVRQDPKSAILANITNGYWASHKPTFTLPVVYEDHEMAIVNKPAGIMMYASQGKGGHNTIRYALLHALDYTFSKRRPEPVHRLDKATSGLLVIGKTKPAVQNLSNQFETRRVQKTYTAIVCGMPTIPNNQTASCKHTTLSSQEAFDAGFTSVDPNSCAEWNLISSELNGKTATTLWRVVSTHPSHDFGTQDGSSVLSIVELKPKTGRYHQLRRQMSWLYHTPILGDVIYGNGGLQQNSGRYHRGLMLCSNHIVLQHHDYNTPDRYQEWKSLQDTINSNGGSRLFEDLDGEVWIEASVPIPDKFHKLLENQARRVEATTE